MIVSSSKLSFFISLPLTRKLVFLHLDTSSLAAASCITN